MLTLIHIFSRYLRTYKVYQLGNYLLKFRFRCIQYPPLWYTNLSFWKYGLLVRIRIRVNELLYDNKMRVSVIGPSLGRYKGL